MANFTSDSDMDYLYALSYEQEDILEYLVNLSQADESIASADVESDRKSNSLDEKEQCISVTLNNVDVLQHLTKSIVSNLEFVDWRIYNGNNWHRTANLLAKLNKKWRSISRDKSVNITKVIFHREEDGDGDGLIHHYNIIRGHIKLNEYEYQMQVIETWKDYELNDPNNYKFEFSIAVNDEVYMKRIEDSLKNIYQCSEYVINIIQDMIGEPSIGQFCGIDSTNKWGWVEYVWMPILVNDKHCNENNQFLNASEMETCLKVSKLMRKFIDCIEIEKLKVKYETYYVYSVC